MHYKALAFHALIALGVAESLTDAINEFPSCSIKCLSDNVADKGCQLTDFNCICKEQVSLAVKLGICTGASCTGTFSGFGESSYSGAPELAG